MAATIKKGNQPASPGTPAGRDATAVAPTAAAAAAAAAAAPAAVTKGATPPRYPRAAAGSPERPTIPPPVSWRGSVFGPPATGGSGEEATDAADADAAVFDLEAMLPAAAALALSSETEASSSSPSPPSPQQQQRLSIVAIKTRREVFAMAEPGAAPLLMHLSQSWQRESSLSSAAAARARAAASRLEAARTAVVVGAEGKKGNLFGLVPHTNPLHSLHFIAVRLSQGEEEQDEGEEEEKGKGEALAAEVAALLGGGATAATVAPMPTPVVPSPSPTPPPQIAAALVAQGGGA